MSEGQKKSGVFSQLFVGIVMALLVGGTSPWWYNEFFGDKEKGLAPKDKLEEISTENLARRQKELEQELREIKQNERYEHESSEPVTETDVSISGTWQGVQGITYKIEQFDNEITLQEITPYYGITAVGRGTIAGREVSISYTTASYTTGTGRLKISENGREMNGTFTDSMSGMRVAASLTR